MSKRSRFPVAEKSINKAVLTHQKYHVCNKKNNFSMQKPIQKPTSASTRGKLSFAQPCERRGKFLKKGKVTDTSSTESTNLSEKNKNDNAFALRKEIDEWRRQNALTSRVNQILGRSTSSISSDIGKKKENAEFTDSSKSTPVEILERPIRKPNPELKEDMSGRTKMKSRRERDKENIAGTWFAPEPEASARTSLKSVADYLSQKESRARPMRPKRRLCLSPGSLKALENAEKLVEEAEKQISQLNLNAIFADDFQTNSRLLDYNAEGEDRAYIRSIVASSFEKGFYDPEAVPRPRLDLSRCASQERLRSGNTTRRPQPQVREPIAPKIDDCPLCSGNPEAPPEESEVKLKVQHGPAISIKADLTIHSSKIVDIPPEQIDSGRLGSVDNVANFEFRHDNTAEASRDCGTKDAETSITERVSPRPSRSSQTVAPDPPEPDLEPNLWDTVARGLREPEILTELDVLLHQQRRVIRKAHASNQALDELVRKSSDKQLTVKSRLASCTRKTSTKSTVVDKSLDDFSRHTSKHSSIKNFDFGQSKLHDSLDCTKSDAGLSEQLSSSSQIPKASNLAADSQRSNGTRSNAGFIENLSSSQIPNASNAAFGFQRSDDQRSSANIIENSSLPTPKTKHLTANSEGNYETGSNTDCTGYYSSPSQISKASNLAADSQRSNGTGPNADIAENVNSSSQTLKASNLAINSHRSNGTRSKADLVENVNSLPEVPKTSIVDSTSQHFDKTESNADLVEKVVERSSQMPKTNNVALSPQRSSDKEVTENSSHGTSHHIDSITDQSALSQLNSEAKNTKLHSSSSISSIKSRVKDSDSLKKSNTQFIKKDNKLLSTSCCNSEINDNKLLSTLRSKHTAKDDTFNDSSIKSRVKDNHLFRIPSSTLIKTFDDGEPTQELVSVLEDNHEQQKLNLLRNLESCSIPAQYQYKQPNRRLPFTSTVLGNVGLTTLSYNGSTESSSEAYSEGELYCSSSASYSVGEVRRKTIDLTKCSSSTKASSSSSVNNNAVLRQSIGEFVGPSS